MSKLLPPLCLVLALLSVIAAFALVMTEQPRVGVELHRARVTGDEQYRALLEAQLRDQRRSRNYLIGGLIASGLVFAILAFLSMRPSQHA